MKRRLRLTRLGLLEAGTRFWFAMGYPKWKEGTVIYQRTKLKVCTCYHFGHEYDHKATRLIGQQWRSVWVEVKK